MRKSLLSLSVAAALAAPTLAAAQAAPAPSPITGNMSLVSEYRFRGIDQTFGKPALQGGFDYAHPSGIYLGNWNSNVNPSAGFNGANLEMDFYGGYKHAFGDFGIDVGGIYYYYPGSNSTVDNKEIYLGGSWKFLSVKYYHSIDDYFSVPNTKNSWYLDFGLNYDLGSGWGLVAHYGIFEFKNLPAGDYNDWKLGITKDVGGYLFGATYVDTDAEGSCANGEFYCFPNGNFTKTRDAGKATIVFSVAKTF